jgi:hypothetical protein
MGVPRTATTWPACDATKVASAVVRVGGASAVIATFVLCTESNAARAAGSGT